MKDKIFGVLQRVGRSFMLPIAILPVAGLLLGVGGSFTNQTTLETYGLQGMMGEGTILHAIFLVMRDAGDIVFTNLPILFAIGVAIGMAKKEKDVAALAAAISFFIMHAAIGALIALNGGEGNLPEGAAASVCGIPSLQLGVFGGILVGLGTAALHNRFYRIELPQVLSFFGGTRFVPIICALVYTLVGMVLFAVWPVVQRGIYAVGDVVRGSGYPGTGLYGLMERLLIPFGLHHVFYLPFWQTALGGTLVVGGRTVEGAQNIFFAQLADPAVSHFAVSATRFMSGKFPLMIFGLPGAALAMYRTALPRKKKEISGLLLSAALTSMVTGITEPLEFTFLFTAPLLYGIHCVLSGLAYMLMHICGVGVGMTFSGGLIDLFLFGILQGNAKTGWLWIIAVGIGYFAAYYLIFYTLIRKLDLKTPGRDENVEAKLYRRSDVEERRREEKGGEQGEPGQTLDSPDRFRVSRMICTGLGGKNNISDVDCCATRLRCTVKDAGLVNEGLLRESGASGVIHKGVGVQVIYGPRVTVIKADLEEYLESSEADPGAEPGESTKPEAKDGMEREIKTDSKTEPDKEKIVISSPITGRADLLEHAPDEAFAGKVLGDGAIVTPDSDLVLAPEDGVISFVFDTGHAIGFETDSGISLLIHIGIDTVSLKGEGFTVLAESGQRVKKGTPMLRLDLGLLKEKAYSLASPVICTELEEGSGVRLIAEGRVEAGEALLEVILPKK